MTKIQGWCPMGCGETLTATDDGYITCSHIDCPAPAAAGDILDGRETEHIVVFNEVGFTVRHPLRERLDDSLMHCDLHEYVSLLDGPPVRPGRYRARWYPAGVGTWRFEVAA